MMARFLKYEGHKPIRIKQWKVEVKNTIVSAGNVLLMFRELDEDLNETGEAIRLKLNTIGGIEVKGICKQVGDICVPGDELLEYEECQHNTIMKDMCAECGVNLGKLDESVRKRITSERSVSMVHSIPELRVSKEQAETLGRAHEDYLLKLRKLVLLVDLDQTIIHTTNAQIPADMKDVHHFQLYGSNTNWYHTKFRPHLQEFMENVAKKFEMHICTYGVRKYAHDIAKLIDPNSSFFPTDRILSRDELSNPLSKTGNMSSLFPCGESMVCIIDDREDVWNYSANLVQVKPYNYFTGTGDINAPEKVLSGENEDSSDEQSTSKPDKSIIEASNVESSSPKNEENEPESNIQVQKGKIETLEEKKEVAIEETKPENSENIASTCEVEKKDDDKKLEKEEVKVEGDKNEKEDVMKESYESEKLKRAEDLAEDESEVKTKVKKDELVDTDDYLLYLEEILFRIHDEYYKQYDEKMKYKSEGEEIKLPDLKEIIPTVKKSVLNGVNLVFSGVIPTNTPMEKSRLYNLAKQFGAKVTQDIVLEGSPRTTHLIAAKWGTAKVNKLARVKNVWILNPLWLNECAERWERIDERLYLLNKNDDFSEQSKRQHKITSEETIPQKTAVTTSKPKPKPSPQVPALAVYDPKTGKRIFAKQNESQAFLGEASQNDKDRGESLSSKKDREENQMLEHSQPNKMVDFCPLSGFTNSELSCMGKEVDDACSEGDEMSNGNSDSDSDSDGNGDDNNEDTRKKNLTKKRERESSESEESLDGGECPRGWSKNGSKKKKVEADLDDLDSRDSFTVQVKDYDDSDSSESNPSVGSIDEEYAAALEREFLS